jgi:hypothetical protein
MVPIYSLYGRFLKWFIILVVLGCGTASAGQGPLAVQNRFPLHLVFLTPRPAGTELPGKGHLASTLSVDYNSVYVDEQSSRWSVLADMEMTVVELSLVYGITSRFAVSAQIPFVSMNDGFLDGFLENFHDAFGLPNYGREDRPENSFAYDMNKDGLAWFDSDGGELRWADMTVSGQMHLFRVGVSRKWSGTLLSSVKLPIGDESRVYGSGRLDAGIFLPTQWDGQKWSLYLMPGYIWHSDPKTRGADVSARNSFSMFGGLGYAYSDRTRWFLQLNYSSSPIEKTGISTLDDGAVEMTIGFRHMLNENWRVEFAFSEDIFTRTAPDFNLHLGVVRSFELRRAK